MSPAPERPLGGRRDGRLQIGRVAELCGLSLRTVRYYEEQGLIAPDARSEGGFRLYTDEQVQRLLLIKQMKPLGFTVAEMRELLDARDLMRAGGEGAAEAGERLGAYAADAAARCEELRERLGRAEEFAAALRAETAASAPIT
ncbi:MAG: MerR family transcriptional regulator [Solirubrobacterales bacterium]|nr:MerR family transcriptional regulator [Solirubrobacterales bacterium]